MITIEITANPDTYSAATYNIPFVSKTAHLFEGRGIHNRGFRHTLQVWDNVKRQIAGTDRYVDPQGHETSERFSFLWSPSATVISSSPALRDNPVMGPVLALDWEVELTLEGLPIGTFKIEARPCYNPHMTRVVK